MAGRSSGQSDTFEKFKADIKRLSKEDKSFAEGVFRHRCPRNQKEKKITIDICKKVIGDCKRKITIPPSAVALLGEHFDNVSERQELIDVNQFLAILSRLINDSEAAKRHRNRKAYGLSKFDVSPENLKRVATSVGRGVGAFLGILEDGGTDPSLEIFQERQRRLTQRRAEERRTGKRNVRKGSIRKQALQFVRLPGSAMYEADYDEDPEEQPLEMEDLADMTTAEGEVEDLSLVSLRKGAPPLPGQDGAPPLPGRDSGAPALPSRDTGAPPLPSRGSTAPSRESIPLLSGDESPMLPHKPSGPPLPERDTGAPPLPGRDRSGSSAPQLPSRDGAPPLPGRDEKPTADKPPLPSRGGVSFGTDAPPLPSRDKPAGEADNNILPLPKRDYSAGTDFFDTKEEALAYYRRRAAKEKSGSIRRDKKKEEKKEVTEDDWKNAKTKSVKDRLKQKFIKKKVETMPVFSPWMIYLITYAQLIVVTVLVHTGKFDVIHFDVPFHTFNVSTLVGTNGYEQTSRYLSANLWIGPKPQILIENGATFSPCMRKDINIYTRYRRVAGFDSRYRDGCCVKTIGSSNRGVHTNERKCRLLYGPQSTFYNERCDALRNRLVVSTSHSACCAGFQGHCQQMTLVDCTATGGTYHRNKTCLEVNCLAGLCKFGGLQASATIPYAPVSPNQWWRFFTSLFVHHGCIHVVLVAAAQVYIGRRIERTAGWLRLCLIYVVSGMMGNVAAGYASPYTIVTGGNAGLAGLLAVLFVELFNMWKLVRDPVHELTNLGMYLVLMFLVGTLPHFNNYAHLAGFIFGLLMAVILLPYVSFGKWAIRRKRILVGIAFTTLFTLIIVLLLFFYLVQSSEFCPKCDRFNCISWKTGFCNQFKPTPATDAVLYSTGEVNYYRSNAV